MAIYNKSGLVLDAAYDLDGASLDTAYEVDGTEIPLSGYPISNIVSYYQQPTLAAKSELDALSDDWVNVIFITDTHTPNDEQHSQAIALYLLANSKIDKLIFGGDYVNNLWVRSEYTTYFSPILAYEDQSKIYALMGNHETYGTDYEAPYTSVSEEAKAYIYRDFLQSKSLSGNPQEVYYYVDDSARKIRYLFLNTSDQSNVQVSSTQRAWITQSVVLPDTDWSLIVFGHVTLYAMAGVTEMNVTNAEPIIEAIAGTNGNLVGYFCGHQHCDIMETYGGFHHSTYLCDRFENNPYYSPDVSYATRTKGTVSEQAVTIISVNTKTRQVVARRIGAEMMATMSYSY